MMMMMMSDGSSKTRRRRLGPLCRGFRPDLWQEGAREKMAERNGWNGQCQPTGGTLGGKGRGPRHSKKDRGNLKTPTQPCFSQSRGPLHSLFTVILEES